MDEDSKVTELWRENNFAMAVQRRVRTWCLEEEAYVPEPQRPKVGCKFQVSVPRSPSRRHVWWVRTPRGSSPCRGQGEEEESRRGGDDGGAASRKLRQGLRHRGGGRQTLGHDILQRSDRGKNLRLCRCLFHYNCKLQFATDHWHWLLFKSNFYWRPFILYSFTI